MRHCGGIKRASKRMEPPTGIEPSHRGVSHAQAVPTDCPTPSRQPAASFMAGWCAFIGRSYMQELLPLIQRCRLTILYCPGRGFATWIDKALPEAQGSPLCFPSTPAVLGFAQAWPCPDDCAIFVWYRKTMKGSALFARLG